MNCVTCGGTMTLLLISAVCDRCDRRRALPADGTGYVLLNEHDRRELEERPWTGEYVYVSAADAETYAAEVFYQEPGYTATPVKLVGGVDWETFQLDRGPVTRSTRSLRLFATYDRLRDDDEEKHAGVNNQHVRAYLA